MVSSCGVECGLIFACVCSDVVQSGENPYMPMSPVNKEQVSLLGSTDVNEGDDAYPLYTVTLQSYHWICKLEIHKQTLEL